MPLSRLLNHQQMLLHYFTSRIINEIGEDKSNKSNKSNKKYVYAVFYIYIFTITGALCVCGFKLLFSVFSFWLKGLPLLFHIGQYVSDEFSQFCFVFL